MKAEIETNLRGVPCVRTIMPSQVLLFCLLLREGMSNLELSKQHISIIFLRIFYLYNFFHLKRVAKIQNFEAMKK
jgi:hypothetical protein